MKTGHERWSSRFSHQRPAGAWAVATQFERLLKRDNAQHSARVASAAPLSPAVRAEIEANLERMYGEGIVISFVEDPGLIGGVRITAGSDVYDGSVRGGLAAIEGRFDHAA